MKILSLIIVSISVMIMLSLTTSSEMSEQQLLEFQSGSCLSPKPQPCVSNGVTYHFRTICECGGSMCVASDCPPPPEQ